MTPTTAKDYPEAALVQFIAAILQVDVLSSPNDGRYSMRLGFPPTVREVDGKNLLDGFNGHSKMRGGPTGSTFVELADNLAERVTNK